MRKGRLLFRMAQVQSSVGAEKSPGQWLGTGLSPTVRSLLLAFPWVTAGLSSALCLEGITSVPRFPISYLQKHLIPLSARE